MGRIYNNTTSPAIITICYALYLIFPSGTAHAHEDYLFDISHAHVCAPQTYQYKCTSFSSTPPHTYYTCYYNNIILLVICFYTPTYTFYMGAVGRQPQGYTVPPKHLSIECILFAWNVFCGCFGNKSIVYCLLSIHIMTPEYYVIRNYGQSLRESWWIRPERV